MIPKAPKTFMGGFLIVIILLFFQYSIVIDIDSYVNIFNCYNIS